MARRYWNDNYYTSWTSQQLIQVKGGIKAQSKHGEFGKKWWSKRWIETLESFRIGARLSRGRTYARQGQVVGLDITEGLVTAKVQGTRSGAYSITIKLKTFTKKDWSQIINKIVEQPIFAVRLLSNEMPEDIESVFDELNLSLFPKQQKDLITDCSCPDWSNPCKHIAAVFYLMAETFDNDPFLLFKLRGMDRETFLIKLRQNNAKGAIQEESPTITPEPLPVEADNFWNNSSIKSNLPLAFPATLHSTLPKRLGNIPLWRSDYNFTDSMQIIYEQVTQYVENSYSGQEDILDSPRQVSTKS